MALFLPIRVILAIFPIAYFSMAMRSLWRPGNKPPILLLPGVLRRQGRSWEPVDRFRPALIHVVIFGGFPSMRALSSFHSPCFQNRGHSSGLIGRG